MKTFAENIEIKNGSDIEDQDQLIQEMLEIDKLVYGDLSEDDTGPVSYWKEVVLYSFFQLAYFEGKIVGYVDIEKFSDEGVQKLPEARLGVN